MYVSKSYELLFSTLPSELGNNTFEHSETISELDSLGFGPSVLQSLRELGCVGTLETPSKRPIFENETALNASQPEPPSRLSSGDPCNNYSSPTQIYHLDLPLPEQMFYCVTAALLHSSVTPKDDADANSLPLDTAFLQLLTAILSSQCGNSDTFLDGFDATLRALAASISLTALPSSSSNRHSFLAYSFVANNAMSLRPRQVGKSDLYTWREILRLYAEAQVFESFQESSRGERGIQDAEAQLKLFEQHIQDKKALLVLPTSREALNAFLGLNAFVLDVKKLERANAEATCRTRTTLSISSPLERDVTDLVPIQRESRSLPRRLARAIGEVILPVIPHVDDYACLICTHVAFKPIRLTCGHFFCVRCLAKLQRRGVPSCPLCRAPTVLNAMPSNLDYGLLNFIADWFPLESLEKMHSDGREINQEQLEAFGINDASACRIM